MKEVQPGQFIYSRKKAAKELGMPESTVRNRMEKLDDMGNVDIQKDNHFSIVTVCKWEDYQSGQEGKGQAKGQAKDRHRTGIEKEANNKEPNKKESKKKPSEKRSTKKEVNKKEVNKKKTDEEEQHTTSGDDEKTSEKSNKKTRTKFPWEQLAKCWNTFLDRLDNNTRIRHHRPDYISQEMRRKVRKYWKEWTKYDPDGNPWQTFFDLMQEIGRSEGLQEICTPFHKNGIFWLCRKGQKDHIPNWEKVIDGHYKNWTLETTEKEKRKTKEERRLEVIRNSNSDNPKEEVKEEAKEAF